ncbi:MAG: hypothetical protein NVS3B1_19690 [Marmoricola sp.]
MTVVSIRGHVEGEPYSLTLLDGEIWPGDREPASSKAAALVLCEKGLASPRSVVEYLQTKTDVESVTPDFVSEIKAAHEAFTAILELKAFDPDEPRDNRGRWVVRIVMDRHKDITHRNVFLLDHRRGGRFTDNPRIEPAFYSNEATARKHAERFTSDTYGDLAQAEQWFGHPGSKSYAAEQPRDDHGRWRAVEGAIAGAKIAARALLKVPGARQDTELDDHLSNAAGAARARDHLGTYRALRLAQNSLNRMGPAVMSRSVDGGGMPHQHPALLRTGDAIDQAVQAHADLPLTVPALLSFSQMKDEMDALESYEKKAADPYVELKTWSDAARAAALAARRLHAAMEARIAGERVGDVATAVHDRAVAAEKHLTPEVQAVSQAHGGHLEGVAQAVKGEGSLARKLRDKAQAKNIKPSEYAAKIGDSVRYTSVAPDHASTADHARAVLEHLQRLGHTVTALEHTHVKGNPYKGIAANLRTKEGLTYELQFHSKESLAVKNKIHNDYEKFRLPKTPLAEKQKLYDRMQRQSRAIKPPERMAELNAVPVRHPRPS